MAQLGQGRQDEEKNNQKENKEKDDQIDSLERTIAGMREYTASLHERISKLTRKDNSSDSDSLNLVCSSPRKTRKAKRRKVSLEAGKKEGRLCDHKCHSSTSEEEFH